MLKVIVDEIITKIFELHFHTYFDEKLQVKQLIILCKTSVFFYQKHILSTYTVWILQKIYSHDDYDFWQKSFVKSTGQVLSKLHFSLFSRDIVQMRVKFSVHYTVYYVILNNHTWYLRISDLKGSDTYARLNTSVTLRCFITLDIHFSCFVIFLPFEVVL